ncbi:hypothetical protein L3Q82_001487 [Scortum barcoo]|uniref:Uncharacterized protein n=1 Tax=Scortum barcoo TaxID=214431 RepID=A0ACB8W7W2_9TELE|nr:hypothetical protein L3Q82_001487 [Scortum barcoo]
MADRGGPQAPEGSVGLKTARASDERGKEADTQSLWRGIQTITDYKPPLQTCDSSTSLLNALNDFFTRFEAHNSTPGPGQDQQTEGRLHPTGCQDAELSLSLYSCDTLCL